MKPAEILALLTFKPKDIPKMATIKNKPTWASIKAFQESIQDQSIAITTFDHNLSFFGMVLQASYFGPLSNGNLYTPPIDPGPAPANAISTSAQITEVVRIYK